jgi:hypothetical protein
MENIAAGHISTAQAESVFGAAFLHLRAVSRHSRLKIAMFRFTANSVFSSAQGIEAVSFFAAGKKDTSG